LQIYQLLPPAQPGQYPIMLDVCVLCRKFHAYCDGKRPCSRCIKQKQTEECDYEHGFCENSLGKLDHIITACEGREYDCDASLAYIHEYHRKK
jgi:hypothetical protein